MNEQIELKKETEATLQATYDRLFTKLADTIKEECDGRLLTVCMPVMDALGAHCINTIMLLEPQDRQQFFLTFIVRLKTWYEEAQQKEGADKSRIITLN